MQSSASSQIDLLAPTRIVAGVDEAGRGCLAGPVYAAAVVLDPKVEIKGLNDSKKLSAAAREKLFDKIQQGALSWSIARAESHEIDSINILQASLLAMKRAVETLTHAPHEALVDGNQAPKLNCKVTTIIDGDALEPAIMAASILAKVARDREMERLDAEFPGYGFSKHKGYGTAQHMNALRELGVTSIHRMSFAPCVKFATAR
ncbi:ribonuclease HII [Stenotrophobium rhamnosiphilum]|uniref:Ribonuclease HII n=1 Tax=Stenotrophobium rhamnosiphilum TaxID=2029166 RepID=A0A2T5MHX2_9GAMM|nr:ribonuclease HII [Stenotrophobium rhamnosiphilum]PTU32158.1 ribonuclease HII [Stenotrophobium rhamnosiphilum]